MNETYLDPEVKQKILEAMKEILRAGGYGDILIQYQKGKPVFVNHTVKSILSRCDDGDAK